MSKCWCYSFNKIQTYKQDEQGLKNSVMELFFNLIWIKLQFNIVSSKVTSLRVQTGLETVLILITVQNTMFFNLGNRKMSQ